MTRRPFGGGPADVATQLDGDGRLIVARNSWVTIYTGQTGGPVADLLAVAGGAAVSAGRVASDPFGMVGSFLGPDDETDVLWGDAGSGDRIRLDATDVSARVTTLEGSTASTAALTAETVRAETAESLLVPQTTTVNGHALTGPVTLVKGDVGLGSVDNTADASKPVSTAQAAAIAAAQAAAIAGAPVQSVAGRTGTVTLAKTDVGLGSVDNTSDTAKPVSTAQAAAIAVETSRAETAESTNAAAVAVRAPLVPEWQPATVYKTNQLATHGGVLYQSSSDHTSGGSWTGVNWTQIAVTPTAANATFVAQTAKGAAGGVATLDGSGAVAQTPKLHAARHSPGGADDLFKTGLPHISTTSLGCTGVTDDTTLIQTAIDAVPAAAPVVVVVDCPILLDGTNTSNGVTWAVGIKRSNVTFEFRHGGKVLRTQASGCPFFACGGGAPAGMTGWATHRYTDATFYPISAVTKGAISVICTTPADAGNFAVGDYIYVRSGQLTSNPPTGSGWDEPDAETFKVSAVNAGTGVITLTRPTGKPFVQEYYPTFTVTNKALTGNVATLTISGTIPYAVGATLTVAGVDATFNGTWTVTAKTSATVSFALVAGDVASTASSGTIVGQGGVSTTTVTAYLAPLNVAKVTDRTINNISFIDPEFDCASTDRNVISAWQVEDLKILRPRGRAATGLQTGRDMIGVLIDGGRFHQYGSGSGHTYMIAAATGTSDFIERHNKFTAEKFRYVHIHEGVVRPRLIQSVYLNNAGGSTDNVIDVRARVYDPIIDTPTIGGVFGYGIFTDQPGPGVIRHPQISGTVQTNAMRIDGAGWTIDVGDSPVGTVKTGTSGVSAGPTAVHAISAWITNATASRTIGGLPANACILRIKIVVQTAFNGSPSLTIGTSGDATRYMTAVTTALASTGEVPTIPAGTGANQGPFVPSRQNAVAALTAGGASTGLALIVIEYVLGGSSS